MPGQSKVISINASQRATGGGPTTAPTLTPLEERVANILGRDFGPLADVSKKDQFAFDDVSIYRYFMSFSCFILL